MKSAAWLLVMFFAASGCSAEQSAPPPAPADQRPAQPPPTLEEQLNTPVSASSLTGSDSVLQLAIPIEVSSNGVKVLGPGEVVRAPRPQPGSGPQLRVSLVGTLSDGKFQREYEMPDPRLKEIEGQGEKVATSARTFVYVDLNWSASTISVKPSVAQQPPMFESMNFNGAAKSDIQLLDVAGQACAGAYATTLMCQQIRSGR
jgi:hypothetical protein